MHITAITIYIIFCERLGATVLHYVRVVVMVVILLFKRRWPVFYDTLFDNLIVPKSVSDCLNSISLFHEKELNKLFENGLPIDILSSRFICLRKNLPRELFTLNYDKYCPIEPCPITLEA